LSSEKSESELKLNEDREVPAQNLLLVSLFELQKVSGMTKSLDFKIMPIKINV
jgi:hypothetical protein